MRAKKIAIVAGGTGGHVFPALSLANKLIENKFNVLFVTDPRGAKYINGFAGKVLIQNVKTSSRFRLYVSLLVNIITNIFTMPKHRADLAIGFGGYPSVPFLIASKIWFGKIAIHEQNAVAGKANKLLSRFTKRIFKSFEQTKGLPSAGPRLTGCPTRFESCYEAFSYGPKKNDDLFKILIVGGSQGSVVFSGVVLDAVSELNGIYVYHQCRPESLEHVSSAYLRNNVSNKTASFFTDIDSIYKDVDLVISRSGASTVFELVGFKLPSILIPFKKSINGDQLENAKRLAACGGAVVLDEDTLSKDVLLEAISELLRNKDLLKQMSENTRQLYISHSTDKLFDAVTNYLV